MILDYLGGLGVITGVPKRWRGRQKCQRWTRDNGSQTHSDALQMEEGATCQWVQWLPEAGKGKEAMPAKASSRSTILPTP